MKTYNQYIQEGIADGTIKSRLVDGVRVYAVRRPRGLGGCDYCNKNWSCMDAGQGGVCTMPEEVVGYTNFSHILADRTATNDAVSED